MRHPLWNESGRLPLDEAADSEPAQRYLVLPSSDDPRLVIPTRPRRASSTVLQALRDRTSLRARVRTAAMGAAATVGARSQLLPSPPLFTVVAAHLGRPEGELVFGVHLGPPRANRKPVIAVANRDGTLLAFAKYGVDQLTDDLVAHEAQALRELAEATEALVDAHCTVPVLIASGRHDGHAYAIQTPVPTSSRPGSARRSESHLVVDAQRAVARVRHDAIDPESAGSAIGDSWRQRAATSSDPVVNSFAALGLSWVEQVSSEPLSWGSWHGDWRTTNMSVTRDGCSVWDWERFSRGVPVGYDALHLFLTTRLPSSKTLSSLPQDVLDNAPRLLRPFGVTGRRAVDLTAVGYLLELAGRYLDDDQARAGARLGAVGEWLLPALDSWTQAHTSTRGGTHR